MKTAPLPLPWQEKSCEIFYRHLSVKRRGSPLWIPEPNKRLPVQYQKRGIVVGDVGIITASGAFDFLFNICLPHDDPINEQEDLPENFSPLDPPLRSRDIREYSEFKADTYLGSASIERSQRDGDSPGLTFESSASEGAILAMPLGSNSHDLGNVSRFREYMSANAEHWYVYANKVRGLEAKNGDIRLVIGCDKTSAW
ncbi:hypothetical protein BDZ97DRAFT_1656614, partial [Flammula alnicola]